MCGRGRGQRRLLSLVYEVLNGFEGGQSSDQPIPTPSNGEEENSKLVSQQEENGSLSEMGSKAEKQEDSYCRKNGILVHVKLVDLKRSCLELLCHHVEGKRCWTLGTEV